MLSEHAQVKKEKRARETSARAPYAVRDVLHQLSVSPARRATRHEHASPRSARVVMPRLGALALVLVGVVCAFAAAQGAHAVAASSRKHLRRTLNDSDLASAAPAPPFHRSPAPAPSLVDVEASQCALAALHTHFCAMR